MIANAIANNGYATIIKISICICSNILKYLSIRQSSDTARTMFDDIIVITYFEYK